MMTAATLTAPIQRRQAPIYALFAANAISLIGSQLTLIAIPWFVLVTTGSAAKTGITAFVEALSAVIAAGLEQRPGVLVADLGIARGLDYYTGTVYETQLVGSESWGSVCSGGHCHVAASASTCSPERMSLTWSTPSPAPGNQTNGMPRRSA